MKYKNGEEVKVGDQVKLGGGDAGMVVGVIDANSFAHDYSAEEWAYLKTGLLILANDSALLHYPELDEDVELIARGV